MGDLVKIGVKTALIAVITTAIIALFANITIPAVDLTSFSQALGVGLAVMYHWVPVTVVLFPVVLGLIAFQLALWAFNLVMIATRWIMKVNE